MELRFRQFAVAFILIAVSLEITVVNAQTPRERHDRIRASVDSRDFTSAISELQAWRSIQPDVFAFNNYDYLLARLAERTGDRATAAVNYQRVIARNSLLSEYAIWHLSQFSRMTGNLTLEREQLRQLLATSPKSLLRDAAASRLAQSLFESGDFEGAIYELKSRVQSNIGVTARESLTLLAQAYAGNNQPQQARETFGKLISEQADPARPDDFSLASARGLDALDSGSEEAANKSAPQLSESEHSRRARIYHFNRDFARARLHYSAIIRGFPQSAAVPDALYQIGRSFYQDGMYEDSLSNLTRLLSKYPDSPIARDGQSLVSSTYSRLKRTDEAVAGYRRYLERYPDAPDPERPYLNMIDVFRDAGRDQDALEWIEQTREKFKGTLPAALALFSRAKIYLAQANWSRALPDLEALRSEPDLGGTRLPGGSTPIEISYLRAFVLEQMGRTDEAIKGYLEIPDGRGEYYGGRATERLQALAYGAFTRSAVSSELDRLRRDAQKASANAQPDQVRITAQRVLRLTNDQSIESEMMEVLRRSYLSLPAYNTIPKPKLLPKGRTDILTSAGSEDYTAASPLKLANELLFLGLADEGAPALAATRVSSEKTNNAANAQSEKNDVGSATSKVSNTDAGSSLDEAYTLAILFNRGEHADHAVRYAEPLWRNVPRDFILELAPREMVELLYPAPYPKALNNFAPRSGVDPRFVLAIMRQESRYRPDVKSVSAARGLMQFIPATADKIALQLGKRNFRQDELYSPDTAILFGSQYLGNLFKLFPQMPQAVAASYNGGEEAVARWTARARSNDPDRYVAEIGFAQTKDYVYKVMANYRVYQKLYGEGIQTR